jgi:hypothetical protein
MAQYGLGRLFDVGLIVPPIDLAGGAQTGGRVRLLNGSGCTFIYVADAGTATEDVDLDVQQHNVASGGTPADLDTITQWYSKRETTLDNDEVWVRSTQAAGSEVDLGDDEGEVQTLAAVEVNADMLTAGYEWVSLNTTDSGTTAGKFGAVIAIVYDLKVMRRPDRLPVLL